MRRARSFVLPSVLAALTLATGVPAMGQVCSNWQVVAGNPNSGFRLNDVAWGGGRWVAVGEAGIILTSSDGLAWRRVSPLGGPTFGKVVWGEPGFVALTGAQAFTSVDGEHWQAHPLPASVYLGPVAWGRGSYVIASMQGTFSSPDGVAWTQVRGADLQLRPAAAIFDGTRFVVVGSRYRVDGFLVGGLVMTSSDAVTWDVRDATPGISLEAIAFNGTRYVASGWQVVDGFNRVVFLASSDALTWQSVSGPYAAWPPEIVAGSSGFVATGDAVWSSPDGLSWTKGTLEGIGIQTGLATDGARFVTVGFGDVIFASDDGVSWRRRSPEDFAHLADVVWTGRGYVAVGVAGTVMVSTDGRAWETIAPITTENLARVFVVGSKLQAFTDSGAVFESADGRGWRARPALHAPSLAIAYGAGAWVSLAGSGVYRSVDLMTWQETTVENMDPARVVWAGSRFVVGGIWSIFTSPDGTTWKEVGAPSELSHGFVVLDGNASTILLYTEIGASFASTDGGETWQYIPETGNWAGSRFVNLGNAAWPVQTSWDGFHWVDSGPTGMPTFWGVAGTQREIVAVGDSIIRGECPAGGEPVYLPAAAHNSGENSTRWQTDAFVANLGPTQASFTLELLQRNRENLTPASTTFTLAPGVMATYPDVVGSVFNLEGAGTLRVTPLDGEVTASERVYETTGPTAFGQHVAGLAEHTALGPGQRAKLIGLSQSGNGLTGARTNIGVVNAGAVAMVATVELYRADGTLLGTRTYPLRPYQSIQQTRIFAEVTADAVPAGYAIVSTPTEGARFFAYAFLVDNVTGAPELVFPQ